MTGPGLEHGVLNLRSAFLSTTPTTVEPEMKTPQISSLSREKFAQKRSCFLQVFGFQVCVYVLHYKGDFAVSFLIRLCTLNNLSTHLFYSSLPWAHQAASAWLASLAVLSLWFLTYQLVSRDWGFLAYARRIPKAQILEIEFFTYQEAQVELWQVKII